MRAWPLFVRRDVMVTPVASSTVSAAVSLRGTEVSKAVPSARVMDTVPLSPAGAGASKM
jgi:hypothetical protein